MIGPDFLSTFQLKPIETILDWENARRWKVYFESEIYRRRCLESTVVASEDSSQSEDSSKSDDSPSAGMRRRRYSDVPLPETLTMELTLNEVVHILEVMTNHFDRNHWSMVEGDLMKEIRFRMRRQGFRNRDLVEEIGSKGYVSDILNRRKPLTLRTARIFRDFFDIPAEWLLGDYLDCEVPD